MLTFSLPYGVTFKYMQLWDNKLVYQISSHPAIKRVVVLGTLCAIELQAEGCNAGYGQLTLYYIYVVALHTAIHLR